MRKLLALVAVAAIAFGVMGASAAYLGDMNPDSLGATSAYVYSCNDGEEDVMPVTFQLTFSALEGEYLVDTVTITNATSLNMCQNMTYHLALSGPNGAQEVTGTYNNTSPWVIPVYQGGSGPTVYASDVEDIALAFTGPAL